MVSSKDVEKKAAMYAEWDKQIEVSNRKAVQDNIKAENERRYMFSREKFDYKKGEDRYRKNRDLRRDLYKESRDTRRDRMDLARGYTGKHIAKTGFGGVSIDPRMDTRMDRNRIKHGIKRVSRAFNDIDTGKISFWKHRFNTNVRLPGMNSSLSMPKFDMDKGWDSPISNIKSKHRNRRMVNKKKRFRKKRNKIKGKRR